jgi:hypothetical protein
MTPHRNAEGLVEWFEHPEPTGKTMILQFVKDCGFGNQCFEISAAYGIAKRTGCHLRWTWEPSTLRKFELEPVGFAHTKHDDVPILAHKLGQGNAEIVLEIERRIRLTTLDRFVVSCPFQEEVCFRRDQTILKEFFRPNLPPLDLKVPKGSTPVGVQVRRTDYVGHGRLDVVTTHYFRNAMDWMRDNVDNPHFFIVSDDPTWCRHTFGKVRDVTVMPPQNSLEGLRTLIACEAHIISNSTFGWWGAWLGEQGPVVVPERWHNNPGSYGKWEIIPPRWQRVSVGGSSYHVTPRALEPHEYMEPLHERAVVIPWKQSDGVWSELRYCLRSIEKYFEDKECPIYVLGTIRPPWFLQDTGRVKFLPCPTYRQALVTGVQIAEKVVWFNDDVLLVNPTTWADCERTLYLRDVGGDFLEKADPQNNPWRAGCLHILKHVKRMGIKKLRVFSTHTPYVFHRKKAVATLEEFGCFEKFPMELAYFHLHANKKLGKCEDYRVQGPDFGDKLFLNFTDATLTADLKAAIEERFPEYAPWELRAKF